MARRRWIQLEGKLYEVGVDAIPELDGNGSGPAVRGDLPDFVSPIDGTVVSGRVQMREHCRKHDVVPTAELKGLPPKTMNQEYKPDREATRRVIADIINSKSY
jgi:hypothetical protein